MFKDVCTCLCLCVCIGLCGCGNDEGLTKEEAMSRVAEAVDLGLSVKWASHNVGATAPEEYGGLYGWGDPTGKKIFCDEDYASSRREMSKDMRFDHICGDELYDIARVKWGGQWRLPSSDELKELKDKCTWTWTTRKGVAGYNVEGPSGKSIFLPAAGERINESIVGRGVKSSASGCNFNCDGDDGDYWGWIRSGSLDYVSPINLGFSNKADGVGEYVFLYIYRGAFVGCSVRPVSY